jgi:hypothetical protein
VEEGTTLSFEEAVNLLNETQQPGHIFQSLANIGKPFCASSSAVFCMVDRKRLGSRYVGMRGIGAVKASFARLGVSSATSSPDCPSMMWYKKLFATVMGLKSHV